MHDIDRTLTDMGSELEMEAEYEAEYENGYEPDEMEFEADDDDEFELEFEGETGEGVFDEEEEYDLAVELLSTTDDEELELFLGKLIRRAGRKIKKAVRSPVGRALRRGLRRVAKRALPIVGRIAGTAIGGPAGGAIGSRVARAGGRIFGLELEGLSGEDQEFEVARRVVRLAGAAAKNAAVQPPSPSAAADAKRAVVKAAKVHAPGLVGATRRPAPAAMAGGVPGHSGRWVRRGRKIVLMGV
ncbi:MAG: hypothetical protein ACFBWO_05295 [Paracoccaceae bacterium]